MENIPRSEIGREVAYSLVVFRHFFDISLARDSDAVLRPFELRLKVAVVLVHLEPSRDAQPDWRGSTDRRQSAGL